MAQTRIERDTGESGGASELRYARAVASFPVNIMGEIIHGGEETLQRKKVIDRLIAADSIINPEILPFLSRAERYRYSIQCAKRIIELRDQEGWTHSEYSYALASTAEWHSLSLQEVYLAGLTSNADQVQLEKYLQPSKDFKIIGCYAQTEMAHGSNVRGLLTTATYIPETDEFDIHTPCLEATKWWVGALGKSATHAVVFARLILPSGDHGINSFMVPLRSMKDHTPLPGVTVGDIGPKMGFAGVDNGFVSFNHVRIPRTEMLSRFAKVLPGGAFEKPKNQQLSYGGMTATRANIAMMSGAALAKAATIAVRYSLIRRQSGKKDEQETQIIDYYIQQYRIFPQIANSYALHFAGVYLIKLLNDFRTGSAAGNYDLLPELHVSSSGLKSLCTTIAANGIEECRKCCGGHGYSQLSGLPDLYGSFVHVCTAEGDNYLLTQQTSRYLVKSFQQNLQGQYKAVSEYTKYLEKPIDLLNSEKCSVTKSCSEFLDPKVQMDLYAHRAGRNVANLVEKLEKGLSDGKEFDEVWNSCLVEVYQASVAHCMNLILIIFIQTVEKSSQVPSIRAALKRLCDLFALYNIEKDLIEFVADGYMNQKQIQLLKCRIQKLVKEVRIDAISYVDAWDFPDHSLNSAIGRYNGNVYETLYNLVQKEPLNQKPVDDGYQFLRTLIQSKL